ncbi:uncharacterized protein LOC113557859 [Rhopalosiphum maidis]|uniref:uncharacterized protein LOC113557859 n=1 Tax=Rhopalosiphum maidis TaxID=43146 RepID=UPI000EFFB0E0|nr:uncharacterized protein LOC113557859 [Rhopalosiphum maidis]
MKRIQRPRERTVKDFRNPQADILKLLYTGYTFVVEYKENSGKMNESNDIPLDPNKVDDQPERSPNFVGKITNTVRNVTNYLQSNGNRAYFWGAPAIEPENNGADTNSGTGQRATNDPNVTRDEPGLMTTIRITQNQLDKRLQCTICLDDYDINEEAMKLTCGHIFHEKCITHWIIMHGTCPVCRRYYCPGELHLPRERVGPIRSMAQRLYRTIRSPLVYFFPHLGREQVVRGRRRPTPMYRLVRAERVTAATALDRAEHEASEATDDYIFCHVMFVLQNTQNEPHPGPPDAMAANMRSRYGRLHPDVRPAGNPPPDRPEFQFPPDVLMTEYLGHY